MSGGEAGGQRACRGHGGHRCAAETGDGLRQLAGHLDRGGVGGQWAQLGFMFLNKIKLQPNHSHLPCGDCSRSACALRGQWVAGWAVGVWHCWG